MTKRRTLLALTALGSLLWHAQASAQASPYVSALDPAYRDVDALIAVGLVPDAIVAQRPYSRAVLAQFVREARANLPGAPARAGTARIQEALERLAARFTDSVPEPTLRLREARLDATLARSPDRSVPTSYSDFGSSVPVDGIDAVLNPVLQRNQGRLLADGATGGAEAEVDLRLAPAVAGQVRARVSSAWTDADGASADGMLQRGYLVAQKGNTVLTLGREYAVNGQGRFGGTMLSDNARALDMVRLSSGAPFHLPGLFRGLGVFELSALLGDMGADRDIPHSKIIVFEGSWRPSRHFEIGSTLLNVQGGEGAPEATFATRLDDIFLWILGGTHHRNAISDKVAGVNARFTVPELGLEVYLDGSTTDINWSRWETLWDEAAWIAGGRITGLGSEGRLDVRVEGHRTGVRPYTHHEFTSGLTLDRRIMGSPLGPMATGWEVGVDWNAAAERLSLTAAWERYRGDEYRNNGLENTEFRWDRVSDNPDEIRVRLLGEWLRQEGSSGFYTQVNAGYERVTRFAFTDENRSNALVQIQAGWIW